MTLYTFEAVQEHYNSIKVLTSTVHHWSEDIRPLGDRKNKHERIIKFSDNCYGLSTGDYGELWVNTKREDGTPRHPRMTMKEVRARCTILWQRYTDGRVRVRVTNTCSKYGSIRGYYMLAHYLPAGLRFIREDGRQYISHNHEWYRLPKRTHLTFEKTADDYGWKLVSPKHADTKPVRVVRKGLKAKYKKPLAEFLQFTRVTGPLLTIDQDTAGDMAIQLLDAGAKDACGTGNRYNMFRKLRRGELEDFSREVIRSRDHEGYLPLAYMAIYWVTATWEGTALNNAIMSRNVDRVLGFTKIIQKQINRSA